MSEEPLRRRRHRHLSDAERTLWTEVTRGIAPLRPLPLPEGDSDNDVQPIKPIATAKPTKPAKPPPRGLVIAAAHRPPPPLVPLGRRLRQRIARGNHVIGGRYDLHGLTQHEAHDALLRFLHIAQSRGDGLVLVITGKGVPGAETGGRGVLRRQVPLWLRLPAFRDLVIGFESAHVTHGGEGALYIRLRRSRDQQ